MCLTQELGEALPSKYSCSSVVVCVQGHGVGKSRLKSERNTCFLLPSSTHWLELLPFKPMPLKSITRVEPKQGQMKTSNRAKGQSKRRWLIDVYVKLYPTLLGAVQMSGKAERHVSDFYDSLGLADPTVIFFLGYTFLANWHLCSCQLLCSVWEIFFKSIEKIKLISVCYKCWRFPFNSLCLFLCLLHHLSI